MEDRIEKLEEKVSELEGLLRQATAAIKRNSDEIAELKKPTATVGKKVDTPQGKRTFGPPKRRAKQSLQPSRLSSEHVIPSEAERQFVMEQERKSAGLWAGRSQMIVTLCDEPKCVAGAHRKVMSKTDGLAFNSQRSALELASMDKAAVRFQIESLSSELDDGHWVYPEKSFPLPSGRTISVNRAVQWAFNDHVGEVPRFAGPTCGRKDCSAPSHIKIDR